VSSGPKIVCVDDEPIVGRSIVRSLRGDQLQPMVTTEPEEALSWVLEHEVAVLVSDYHMPSMNGVQLSARVRELRPQTVRVLITGALDVPTALASINEGEVFRFVPKPFSLADVARVIREAVARHRTLAEAAALQRRAREQAELEARFPSITTPARGDDGAYVVPSRPVAGLAGLDELLALRR
jgi:DNA-binding NtrC family response regulator